MAADSANGEMRERSFVVNAKLVGVYSWISVSHVCTHWREGALGCSALWVNVWTTHLGLLKTLVERSKSQLLHVCLLWRFMPEENVDNVNNADSWEDTNGDIDASRDGDKGEESIDGVGNEEMIQLVAINMHRIQSLHVSGSAWRLAHRLLNIPAPRLETLMFSGIVWSDGRPPGPANPGVMPNLRLIRVEEVEVLGSFMLLPLHLPSVTHLDLDTSATNGQLELLRRCPGVLHLLLENGWEETVPSHLDTLVELAHL
ncbi:hypothetical protein AX16_005050 [Volvariella volvacea WC 439]|nr:hypothetical protein AX16_005050 [Volvariella volvacea WC 439]